MNLDKTQAVGDRFAERTDPQRVKLEKIDLAFLKMLRNVLAMS